MCLSAAVCASTHCYVGEHKCVSGPESKSDPSFDTDAAVSPPEYTLERQNLSHVVIVTQLHFVDHQQDWSEELFFFYFFFLQRKNKFNI